MDRIYYLVADTPAGTPIATPVTTPWPLEDNQLLSIEIDVPDGHCGLTGIRILQASQQIVPHANNSYFVANDKNTVYPFDDQITATGLVIVTYNTDVFDHKFYLTAVVTNLPLPELAQSEEFTAASTETNAPAPSTDYLSTDYLLQPNPTTGEKTEPVTVIGKKKAAEHKARKVLEPTHKPIVRTIHKPPMVRRK
jgi:hypothetical protein